MGRVKIEREPLSAGVLLEPSQDLQDVSDTHAHVKFLPKDIFLVCD